MVSGHTSSSREIAVCCPFGNAVVDTGGMPSQFVGDGMMAIFGVQAQHRTK
jgi:hypothetical protein